jgi:hypothetical protein
MATDILEFGTMADAIIRFDLKKCDACESKACIEADHLPFLGPVLELKRKSKEESARTVSPANLPASFMGIRAFQLFTRSPSLMPMWQNLKKRAKNLYTKDSRRKI